MISELYYISIATQSPKISETNENSELYYISIATHISPKKSVKHENSELYYISIATLLRRCPISQRRRL